MKSERYGVPGAFASLLAHERDTPSCLATAAILRPQPACVGRTSHRVGAHLPATAFNGAARLTSRDRALELACCASRPRPPRPSRPPPGAHLPATAFNGAARDQPRRVARPRTITTIGSRAFAATPALGAGRVHAGAAGFTFATTELRNSAHR